MYEDSYARCAIRSFPPCLQAGLFDRDPEDKTWLHEEMDLQRFQLLLRRCFIS